MFPLLVMANGTSLIRLSGLFKFMLVCCLLVWVQDSEPTSEEMRKLSAKNQELREEVSRLKSKVEEEEERHLVQAGKLREEMREAHSKHKQQVATLESSHKVKGRMRGERERERSTSNLYTCIHIHVMFAKI